MATHPYETLPAYCFWPDSVADRDFDPVVRPKFQITPQHKVATAGSGFAQHISRALTASGYSYLVTENAPPLVASADAAPFGYGDYTARYGDIYTARQWLQLLLRAYGAFAPDELAWSDESERFFDPFRPRIQPDGFRSFEALEADRAHHYACVRRAIETMDVLVFELGLTEAWVARADGAVFPVCPGIAGGEFDEAHYQFVNFTVADVAADLETVIWFLNTKNPTAKMILTVSPVPLVATALDRSVLVSTTYSKSVLRVAAEQAAEAHAHVAYFPSYEIIAGPQARGRYYDEALREATAAGVARVTQLFLQHYGDSSAFA